MVKRILVPTLHTVTLLAVTLLAVTLLFSLLLFSCEKKYDGILRVGHGGGYLSAAVFAAQQATAAVDLQQFNSSSDIAYALLSGTLDAGFIDADRLAAFSRLKGFEKLAVMGKITYPYGATLVLRKGLTNRLSELKDLTIAVSSPHCVLLEQFAEDAQRLGSDISDIKYVYIPFDAMLPALEAKIADAVIIKGTYSVIALQEGHSILYQNWEVRPGDECCPAVIDQAVLVLLVRKNRADAASPFITALSSAQNLSPDQLRRAVADNSRLSFEILQGQPVPEFSLADDGLAKIFIEAADEHNGEDHDD